MMNTGGVGGGAHNQANGAANGAGAHHDVGEGQAQANGNAAGAGADAQDAGEGTALWKRWVRALNRNRARLLWVEAEEAAYIQLEGGDVIPLHSDRMARWFQQRSDREAAHGSDKWRKAAGALRSWISQNGERVTVHRGARVDWAAQTAWIGLEDGRHVYRVSPAGIQRVRNGTDGALILAGHAPDLGETISVTGELFRWLTADTWLTPTAGLTLAVYAVLAMIGAQSHQARPLMLFTGPTGTGKTTTAALFGSAISGRDTVAGKMKSREEQNEARLCNDFFTLFDNLDSPPQGLDVEDVLATAATSQKVSIRKMRVEGEVVEKPITAFVICTSFRQPQCLKRGDVIGRSLMAESRKPKGARVRQVGSRAPDRTLMWCDLLVLLQRALTRWPETPAESEHRSVEFVRMAYALLPPQGAAALERAQLRLQGNVAGLDDPILAKLEANPPPEPMTAQELYAWWWPESPTTINFDFDPEKPKSAIALGKLLGNKAGQFGRWEITSNADPKRNVTIWALTPVEGGAGLADKQAMALLRGMLKGRS